MAPYLEDDVNSDPQLMTAYQDFEVGVGGGDKWAAWMKRRAENALSNSVCTCEMPLGTVFSAARHMPDFQVDYFGNRYNSLLFAFVCKSYKKMNGISSLVEHK